MTISVSVNVHLIRLLESFVKQRNETLFDVVTNGKDLLLAFCSFVLCLYISNIGRS